MPIPDYESLMRPLLEHLADGRERKTQETLDSLAGTLGISDTEKNELLPSGNQTIFNNRVAWAKFYLKKALCVETPKRGVYRITKRGTELLRVHSGAIESRTLQQFPEFTAFILNSRTPTTAVASVQPLVTSAPPAGPASPQLTPEEQMERGYTALSNQLQSELLSTIAEASPEFFERLVLELLLAIGYGGSRRDAGRTLGRSGDGGVDGVIYEDRLGLETIYVQAKRWEGTVGRPEIQKFAGALQGQRARKGIFITTSDFTADARAFVKNIDARIVLIDGDLLTKLMIEHGVGVTPVRSLAIKRLDSDYFIEE